MIDIEKLKLIQTPPDDLISVLRTDFDISKFIKIHKLQPFTSYVTHALVSDTEIVKTAKKYIVELLKNKSRYGFLYYLNTKKLIVPLHFNFNGELIIDPQHHHMIVNDIHNIAKDFACTDNLIFEITKIELLYFFTLLINVHLNWVTVDHILGCNKTSHAGHVMNYFTCSPRVIKHHVQAT